MRLGLLILSLWFGCFGAARAAVDFDYAQEYRELIKRPLDLTDDMDPREGIPIVLKFLENPSLSQRQIYQAWRAIANMNTYSSNILSPDQKKKLYSFVPEELDFEFRNSLLHENASIPFQERRRLYEDLFEQSLKSDHAGHSSASIAANAADLYIFNDSPLDAIFILEKGLKTIKNRGDTSQIQQKLNLYLAMLYSDPYQSDENIKKGIAIYEQLADQTVSKSLSAKNLFYFNQGVAYLLSLYDFQKAWDVLQQIGPEDDSNHRESLIYGAAALVGLGRNQEALKLLREFENNKDPKVPEREIFLTCFRDMILFELNQRDDMNSCNFVSDNYYSSALDVLTMKEKIVKRPMHIADEYRLLHNAKTYFMTKFRLRVKNSTANTINRLDMEKSRIDAERAQFEAALDKKHSELKSYVIYSALILAIILSLAVWRVWWKNRKIEALQNYIKTNILQRFLPETLIKEILQGKSRLEQEPQKKLITVLFADLVAFTSTTETLGTENIARLLNDYLRVMTDVVFSENGTIDKFIGDSVMVIFGAPFELPPEDQVRKAVRCADKMFAALEKLNLSWQKEFGTSLQLRIGINTGEAIVGSFGSEKRSDYTVIGNSVNIAARIEALAPPGQVVMSRTSARYFRMDACESLGLFTLKGVTGQQELFRVLPLKENPAIPVETAS